MYKVLIALIALTFISAGCGTTSSTVSNSSAVAPPAETQSNTVEPIIPEVTPKSDIPSAPSEAIKPAPKVETTAITNSPKKECDPNYSGCVPIASDVDCAGDSGNGPAYTGRVTVTGTDIYDLDRDDDGIACE